MRIKLLFLFTFLASICYAQKIERMGTICLVPYIPEDVELKENVRLYLLDKLSQIATAGGVSGQGFDDRFIITANIRMINQATTSTIPSKTTVRISVSFFIGDGIDGTLFASTNKEVTGIGKDCNEAYISAIRKIPTNDRQLLECIETGKNRIIDYYNNIAGSIISSAKSSAASGDYQGGINQLLSIPIQCKAYQQAQALATDFCRQEIENNNRTLLARAKTAWAASPDKIGAEQVREFLDSIQYPSSEILSGLKELCDDVSSRLIDIDNNEWKKEMEEMQNRQERDMERIKSEKERSIAYINAAASVARVREANRPRIIYRIYHWW